QPTRRCAPALGCRRRPAAATHPSMLFLQTTATRADAGPGRTRGVVVVGLDTSEYAAVAALDAAEFAVGSGQRLRVLVGVDALADAAARARAEADLAWLRREFPTLDADAEFPTGDPVDALIRASEDADLIAIGKRGIGQFAA